MRSSTGRWVSGDDFFDRESELRVLAERVRGGSHLLLTGQRRMGKTSVLRELGRRLETEGWVSLFIDVEGATSEKDVVASLAEAILPVRGIWPRFAAPMARWLGERVEQVGAFSFRLKLRDGIGSGSWRRHGERLIRGLRRARRAGPPRHRRAADISVEDAPRGRRRTAGRRLPALAERCAPVRRRRLSGPRRVPAASGSHPWYGGSAFPTGSTISTPFGWGRGRAKPASSVLNASPRTTDCVSRTA